MTVEATIPTPHSLIHCRRAMENGLVEYQVPKAVQALVPDGAKARVSVEAVGK